MVFKSFRVNYLVRIIILSISILLFQLLVQEPHFVTSGIFVLIVIIYQIYMLLKLVNKSNRDVARFLESIKYNDFSQGFKPVHTGSGFEELHAALTEVIEKFQKNRLAVEEQYRCLQTIIQHLDTGIIAFSSKGDIALINNSAKRLLGINHLHSILQLKKVSERLFTKLTEKEYNTKFQVKIMRHNEIFQLSMKSTEYILKQDRFRLISLQNIQSELEESEMEAWQKLIRTLTHEIMNSITPISSLASTADELLSKSVAAGNQNLDGSIIEDVKSSVRTIEKRSRGLMNFVNNYRKLTKIPVPQRKLMQVKDVFLRVSVLMKEEFRILGAHFETNIEPPSTELYADPDLVEQVLINLLKNAAEAVGEKPEKHIILSAEIDNFSRILIRVEDNGMGISSETRENIFIPFFTTKQNGSGIGLSLSKQIMRMHGGTITVDSQPDDFTIFTLRF